jgi:hypothetical protein
MDEIVTAGLKRWPNVPDCFGWLALDGRGRWRIGQERQPITHAPTIAFIGRNYLADETGRWLFQNGPQRVYVELEYTPFVWRLGPAKAGWSLTDHTGNPAEAPSDVHIDEDGRFLLAAHGRIGVLHDHDSSLLIEGLRTRTGECPSETVLASAIDEYMGGRDGRLNLVWVDGAAPLPVAPIQSASVAGRFGFVPRPAPPAPPLGA